MEPRNEIVRSQGSGTRSGAFRFVCLLVGCASLSAQTPEIQGILERLDRLERENRALSQEVQDLRGQLAAVRGPTAVPAPAGPAAVEVAPPTNLADLNEKVDIQGQRVEEQAQSKVEAAQKFPIQITGMALFNTFMNSRQNGGADYPTAATGPGSDRAGATLRQTIVGLEFHGPQTFWEQASTARYTWTFTTTPQWIRLRTGSIELDWRSRSIMVGVEKPIFNPREPSSLAQVGVSPLTGAGNLWLWVPQVRAGAGFQVRVGYRLAGADGRDSDARSGALRFSRLYGSGAGGVTAGPGRTLRAVSQPGRRRGAWKWRQASTKASHTWAGSPSHPASTRSTGSSIRCNRWS